MLLKKRIEKQPPLRAAMTEAYRMNETDCVNALIDSLNFSDQTESTITQLAHSLVESVRKKESNKTGIEALMMYYDLSNEEGVMLMCLAEALLRVPDTDTKDLLIRDKLTSANWKKHIGESESSFVNMATWGLAMTGKILDTDKDSGYFYKMWQGLLRKSGEPAIRQAVKQAVKVMSHQFVIGRTIGEAIDRSKSYNEQGYVFSYDMLGEVARTQDDADRYFAAYENAIEVIGEKGDKKDLINGPSISVKLSALYPRYEFNQQEKAIPILTQRLKALALKAKAAGISLTVDAEEADRLEMSLEIIKAVFDDHAFDTWEGLGLAVQAYQKRAFPLIQWLIDLAKNKQKRIQVRLVKGAYWDSEIKVSQEGGFDGYPVFTRKSSTDLSYIACAKRMLSAQDAIYPQFATHNAYSVAAILTVVKAADAPLDFEFQNLQGMGKSLHDQIVSKNAMNLRCRIYAPVGNHEDLLPYLVRRLLENGANSSFVNQIVDPNVPIEKLVESPIKATRAFDSIPNNRIPLPKAIYGDARMNSNGLDFSNHAELETLHKELQAFQDRDWTAVPRDHRVLASDQKEVITSPYNREHVVGEAVWASAEDADSAISAAKAAFDAWNHKSVEERAAILDKAGDLLEEHRTELLCLAVKEAGKVFLDAVAEVREAVDFCRYYADQSVKVMAPQVMPGPTGESNVLSMHGRGVLVCISPWNFPIAIFAGQVAAALVTGNCVIAKPAEQTPLVAARVVELFHEAGVPTDVLQLLPGLGEVVGRALTSDERIDGVIFTGSTDTAKAIQLALAQRKGAIAPLIAETGGMNAMIVDSSALPEQLVLDVVQSAFGSAGQRCSALRVLFLQDDIADHVIEMLKGAMQELSVDNPELLSTDVGPVIDVDAQKVLQAHIDTMHKEAEVIYEVPLDASTQQGHFIAPVAFLLPELSLLKREVFGPVLHVVRFKQSELNSVIDQINALGYGLTFGIQSRIDDTIEHVANKINVGNVYVNRNMIGAVVGVQPFGGSGLSGTGPKAGGPHYLSRLCHEKTVTINTAAVGGNASLMAME